MINNASAATNHGAAVYVGRFWTRAALRRPLLLSDDMVISLPKRVGLPCCVE